MFLEEGRENMPIFHLGFKRALGKDGCAKSDQFSEKFQKGGRRSFSIQYTLLAFIICLLHWKLLVYVPLSASKFASYLGNYSIKHDLARSCFQLWPKICDEGDKISRKKTSEALAETVFSRNFVSLGADFEGHN